MRPNLLMTIILPQLISCELVDDNSKALTAISDTGLSHIHHQPAGKKIEDIPTPAGYKRIDVGNNSFSAWLRAIQLKKDNRVFLYNGNLKQNQSAQFAVLDIPVGKKDLQQCADAVMRLRAQFLYDHKRFSEISFADNNGKKYLYSSSSGESFERYLEKVYSYCGTLSLEKQLRKSNHFYNMQAGDVLIKGGSPGHAVIVMDMAANSNGNKIYLLAQSYMPAQDIHIVKNPRNTELSPWYELKDNSLIYTPEWVFEPKQLRKWQETE
jgi:hypothetical protein